MADDTSSTAKGGASGSPGKRPHATLDLKATEIKVTPIVAKAQTAASSATSSAAATASAFATAPLNESNVPLPAPASAYAEAATEPTEPKSEARMQAEPVKNENVRNEKIRMASSTASPAAAAASAAARGTDAKVVVEKRGGFFSHLAAGVVGGALVLGASLWAIPEFRLEGEKPGLAEETAGLSQRLTVLERAAARSAANGDQNALDGRVANLEKSVQAIPALGESQSRLVAETKAALAAAASDAGAPQLIERLGKVEDKLKALADAGANDPNAGRVEQLAALTGKVTDLETSLATQLSALRTSVAADVDGRVQSAREDSAAARAGTERIDRDVAAVKSDTARIEARVEAAKTAGDRVAADLKVAEDETAQLKTAVQTLAAATAKPADIAAAIAPLDTRTAALEKSVREVVDGDAARKESAQHVVLALELQNLRRALDSGQKFAVELDEVKKVAGSKIDLSALTRLQDTGVPSLADLNKDFRVAADSAIDADAEPGNATVVDRLGAGAKSVIRVRRIDLKADDKSAEATVGRMQVALNDGRLAEVLEAAKDLSPKAQDTARPFLDKVAARVSVDSALAGLDSELKSSLATGSAEPAKTLP